MRRSFIILTIILGVFGTFGGFGATKVYAVESTPWWQVQSIDTMKYSRDPSAQYLDDLSGAKKTIAIQVKNISSTNATHIAIATPYDDKFLPVLRIWVTEARKNNLKVWFRGNFSGWEGWFGFPKISREQHLAKTEKFILANSDLFEDGDIFSSCPECENGGPGDPRMTGDVSGHKQFLIDLHTRAYKSFARIGKKVDTTLNSMNGDVAKLIMDPQTTKALGGIVTIDHYVKTSQDLVEDIKYLEKVSGGKIFLGEFGAPIPDIHGSMTEDEQSKWLESALSLISSDPNVVGLNYWTSVGGSTEIWDSNGNAKPAVKTLSNFFHPEVISGTINDESGLPVGNAKLTIVVEGMTVYSDSKGKFALPHKARIVEIQVSAPGHKDKLINYTATSQNANLILATKNELVWWAKLVRFFKALFRV